MLLIGLCLFLNKTSNNNNIVKEDLQDELMKCLGRNDTLSEYIDKIYDEHRREVQEIIDSNLTEACREVANDR